MNMATHLHTAVYSDIIKKDIGRLNVEILLKNDTEGIRSLIVTIGGLG